MSDVALIVNDSAEVVTLEQFAARMKVHPRTVKRAIDSGELEASQLNAKRGGWRIEWPAAAVGWLEAKSNRHMRRPPRPLAPVTVTGHAAGAADRARRSRRRGTLRVSSEMGSETA